MEASGEVRHALAVVAELLASSVGKSTLCIKLGERRLAETGTGGPVTDSPVWRRSWAGFKALARRTGAPPLGAGMTACRQAAKN